MKIALWIVQSLLALAFLGAGVIKAVAPIAEITTNMAWAAHFPEMVIRLIGVAEILGGLGLILPAATRIAPTLTPLAAALLAVLMLGAFGTHLVLGDGEFAPSLVLALLSGFVAWGRFKAAPILARGAA